MDVVYNTPNATTMAAMREAKNEENLTSINMDSYESFIKSLDLSGNTVQKIMNTNK